MQTLFALVMLWNGNAYTVDSGLTVTDCADAQSIAYAVADTTQSKADFLCLIEERE